MRTIAPPAVRMVAVMPKHFKASDPKHLAQYWRAREQIRNQWFRGFTKTIKKQFGKEQSAVENAMRSTTSDSLEDDVRKAVLSGTKTWTKLYNGMYVGMAQDIAPMILDQYEGQTGKSYRHSVKADADEWMAYLLDYLETATPPKIKGLTATTIDRLMATIRDGVEAEESMEDIVRRVNDLYGDSITPLRSMTIARTEVTAASNAATQTTGEYMADKYELNVLKTWLTARDNNVRDSHTAMENYPAIALDELFNVNGSEMLHPGDTTHGADLAEIINCRCDCAQSVRD